MEIKTKFDIGQEVYTIRHQNYIYKTKVVYIEIFKEGNELIIGYKYYLPGSYETYLAEDNELFTTKEEAEQKLKEIENAENKR